MTAAAACSGEEVPPTPTRGGEKEKKEDRTVAVSKSSYREWNGKTEIKPGKNKILFVKMHKKSGECPRIKDSCC